MSIQTINHIEKSPDVMGGRARIAGRRVLVADIAGLYRKSRWSVEQIAQELDLTPGQVHAALSYYYDHQDEIERSIQEEEATAKSFRKEHPSPLDPQ